MVCVQKKISTLKDVWILKDNIKRERHQIPKCEEITSEIAGARYFSKQKTITSLTMKILSTEAADCASSVQTLAWIPTCLVHVGTKKRSYNAGVELFEMSLLWQLDNYQEQS